MSSCYFGYRECRERFCGDVLNGEGDRGVVFLRVGGGMTGCRIYRVEAAKTISNSIL